MSELCLIRVDFVGVLQQRKELGLAVSIKCKLPYGHKNLFLSRKLVVNQTCVVFVLSGLQMFLCSYEKLPHVLISLIILPENELEFTLET